MPRPPPQPASPPPTPARMSITRLVDGKGLTAQFNPEKVKEELVANYAELAVLGLSHKIIQYTGTNNLTLSYDLTFDSLAVGGGGTSKARLFLHANLYSSKMANSVSTGGPSDLLFSWPNLYSLTCRMTKLSLSLDRFNAALQCTLFTASITLSEIRTVRLYAEDVLNYGTLRSS